MFGTLLCRCCFAALPLNISAWGGKRVLFIGAHPDDIEGFAGGLAHALHLRGDVNVTYLVVTSGNAGGLCYGDASASADGFYACEKEEIALVRRREMIAAAAFNGVAPPLRMGIDDGLSVEYDEARLRRGLTAWIRIARPHVIVTHFPEPNWRAPPTCNGACAARPGQGSATGGWGDLGYHPDHKRVGRLVFDTAYAPGGAASNSRLFEDIAAAGAPAWLGAEELYFFALTRDQPMTHFLPLPPVLLAAKINASMLHRSQYQDDTITTTKVSFFLFTVTFHANRAHNLTHSP